MLKQTKAQRNRAKQVRRASERLQREAQEKRRNTIAKILKRSAQIASVAGMIFGIYASALSLLPKVGISAASSLNVNDPLATPFLIKNEGYLTLNDVTYNCALYEFKYSGIAVRRHAKEDAFFSTRPKLVKAKVKPNESHTIVCNFSGIDTAEMQRFGPMNKGDIAIVVSFRPAYWFWQREERQRFSTMKSADGLLYWYPQSD